MSHRDEPTDTRRRFLKLMGGSAVLLPLAGLSACSGGEQSSPASGSSTPPPSPKPEPETTKPAEKPAESAAQEPSSGSEPAEPGGEMPRLAESDPQAQSLGYVHEATSVNTSKYPRYQDGQACANCALYQGGDAEWGGCSIFPGRLVKSTGWCSVYAPKAG